MGRRGIIIPPKYDPAIVLQPNQSDLTELLQACSTTLIFVHYSHRDYGTVPITGRWANEAFVVGDESMGA
jgi:hypothetical protein